MFFSAIDNCPHFSNTNFIDYNSLQYFSMRDIFESIKDADYNPKMRNIPNLKKYLKKI